MADSKNEKSKGHQKYTGPYLPYPQYPYSRVNANVAVRCCLHTHTVLQVTFEVSSLENTVTVIMCHDVYVYNFVEIPQSSSD